MHLKLRAALIIITGSMIAEEPSLPWVRLSENQFIKLKFIQIGRVFLSNHPHGIVHLHEITDFIARIGSATVPDFATKKHHVPGVA